jgi:hypothetical protein
MSLATDTHGRIIDETARNLLRQRDAALLLDPSEVRKQCVPLVDGLLQRGTLVIMRWNRIHCGVPAAGVAKVLVFVRFDLENYPASTEDTRHNPVNLAVLLHGAKSTSTFALRLQKNGVLQQGRQGHVRLESPVQAGGTLGRSGPSRHPTPSMMFCAWQTLQEIVAHCDE